MKKVIYIGGFELPDKNAAAQRVMANALLLRDMGYIVSFIGPTKDRTVSNSEINGFKCSYIDYPKKTVQWLRYITEFVNVRKILEQAPNYVVLYNFPAIASLRIIRECHKNNIKVFHDLTEWEESKGWSPREIIRKIDISLRMNYCIKKMDGVIAISRYLYEKYKARVNTILVPPTVDIDNPKWDRNRELCVGSNIQLVYAGTAGFGNKDKLNVVVENVKKFPKIKLVILGMTANQYEQGYGQIPTDCTNIEFRGRVSHIDAVKSVCNSDFQVLIRDNTLKNRAGFPSKFVESFTCCTPVIATNTSNICDYLIDNVNGFVVDNKQSLSQVLSVITSLDKDDIVSMKQSCKGCKSFDYREYRTEFSKLFS